MSIDNHERHRGNDEPDAPLLRELEGAGGEGDVVIGTEQSNEGDHQAADGLDPALAIEAAAAGMERRRGKCCLWFVLGTKLKNHTRCGALQVAPQLQMVQRGTMGFGKKHLHAAPWRPER
ncbi:MAG: hypothetical protein VKN83_08720 [Cyanobacteriota bacterium]|nr:hypothetical protein [Cyanobacteriota bacterium]